MILQDGVAIVADVEQRDSLVLDLRQDAVIVELDGLAIQGVVGPEGACDSIRGLIFEHCLSALRCGCGHGHSHGYGRQDG